MRRIPTVLLYVPMVAGIIAICAVRAGDRKGGASIPVDVGKRVLGTNEVASVKYLRAVIKKVEPFHARMGRAQAGDWLASFEEPGQSFEQWLESNPRTVTGRRTIIYVQPIGVFDEKQKKMVETTASFMEIYFNLKTKTLETMSADKIPASATRDNPLIGRKQILTGYILEKVLQPKLPEDAAVLIAFTADDLWPGSGWNFVFGQASIEDRVGVWSLARMGDTSNDKNYKVALLRTMKIATHETGHMFSILHCKAWECNMNGCNSQSESDRHPLWCCPECMAKICLATGADPMTRYNNLAGFCSTNGYKTAAGFFEKSMKALALMPRE